MKLIKKLFNFKKHEKSVDKFNQHMLELNRALLEEGTKDV